MLSWPEERARQSQENEPSWSQPGSNICLDFHGDPKRAQLVVFSDGNHHMALAECLQRFLLENPDVEDIFYVTTPPGVLVQALKGGGLQLGNLSLTVNPDIFISPPDVLDPLVTGGYMRKHAPFMKSRGNALLVRKGNPKVIRSIADLARKQVRLFLSNPDTERASYRIYADSLKALARKRGITPDFLDTGRVVYGERIHHREAPQALADGRADVAMVYYHLALRYTRVFPDLFELVPISGTADNLQPEPENIAGYIHVGRVGDGGEWGSALLEFLQSDAVTEIYERHGLSREK